MFSGWAQGLGQGPCAPTLVPQVLFTAFQSGFVRHPRGPSWRLTEFPTPTALAVPPDAKAS